MRRSSRLAVVALTVSCVAAGYGPGSRPTEAVAADHGPGVIPMVIGTFNIRADRSLEKFKEAVDAFKQRVQVAGLQEIAEKDKNDYLQQDEDWGYYRPEQLRQNPVIWDTGYFDFVDAPDTGHRIARGREVESKTGGTELKEDSYATVVRLEHLLSGNQVSVINVHLLSGASRVGRPWPGRPLRFELLTDQVRGTVRLIKAEKELGNEVFILGDFNVGFQADEKVRHRKLPYRRYKRVDFVSMWAGGELDKRGTYENAYLDQVWTTVAPERREVAYDIDQSDHFPAIATYLLDLELPLKVPGL